MSNHTPGQWKVEKFNDTKSWSIYAYGGSRSLASVRDEANARLIAAAPEQNALLVEALDLVPRISEDDPITPALAEWCRRVRAVIQKAKS
jgi:hypothetical protein